ncbi:MAG: histidine triad nucleotide-binding protein [Paraclostridium sp.]
MSCIFCKIINGEIPSTKVYEDDKVLAFNDINPVAPMHVLVIPKKHYESILEIDDNDIDIIGHIHSVIKKIVIEKGYDETGFRIINNYGDDGCQEVKHIHFHILAGKKLDWYDAEK